MVKIAYCQATFSRDIELTKECIQRVGPNVDLVIISYDQTVTDKQLKWFEDISNKEKYKLELVSYKFIDNLPEMRNSYLDRAKELGMDWIYVSDPDELYSEELARELRELTEKYDMKGYNMIGIPCRDEFTNIGWLDSGDLAKEAPGGLGGKDTDFWKPILGLKISGDRSDIRYEGVGKEKNVHETVVSSGRVKAINLDKKYFYTHRKNAIKIWRNAARNMFIGGGGDNVGDENILWTELRSLCREMGIEDWYSFEDFVKKGVDRWLREKEKEIKLDGSIDEGIKNEKIERLRDLIQQFESWLILALQNGSNSWQTETRETAKWYYAIHAEEVDDFILGFIEKVPEIVSGSDSDIEAFVARTYFEELGRHPDAKGKSLYVGKIKDGLLRREDLTNILKDSQEYREKFKDIDKTIEKFKDVKIDIKNSGIVEKFIGECYINILGRAVDRPGLQNYTELIMNEKMKLEELIDILKESNEYKQKFEFVDDNDDSIGIGRPGRDGGDSREFKERPSPFIRKTRQIGTRGGGIGSGSEILDLDSIDASKFNTIGLCIMTPSNDIRLAVESIKTIGNVCDEIHIQSDSFLDGQIKELKELGRSIEKGGGSGGSGVGKDVEIHIVEWTDNFGDYKNKACGHARTEWCLVVDHDEVPTEEMAKKLKEIVLKSDRGNNFDIVSFDVIDIITDGVDNKGKDVIVYQNRNKGGKQLLQWNIPNPFFGNLHIWLRQSYYPWKTIHAPYAYKHIKTKDGILENSVRNVVLGGGGDTVKEKNELWVELRRVLKELGLDSWEKTKKYLIKGMIDARMLDILERLYFKTWKDEELKDPLRWYIKMHAQEQGRLKNVIGTYV